MRGRRSIQITAHLFRLHWGCTSPSASPLRVAGAFAALVIDIPIEVTDDTSRQFLTTAMAEWIHRDNICSRRSCPQSLGIGPRHWRFPSTGTSQQILSGGTFRFLSDFCERRLDSFSGFEQKAKLVPWQQQRNPKWTQSFYNRVVPAHTCHSSNSQSAGLRGSIPPRLSSWNQSGVSDPMGRRGQNSSGFVETPAGTAVGGTGF